MIRTALCGASLIRGAISFDLASELERLVQTGTRLLLNFGEDGNLTRDLEARLDAILASAPEEALVIVGTNDVLVRVTPAYLKWKGLEEAPSLADSRESLRRILSRLKSAPGMRRVITGSIPPIGEVLDSAANLAVDAQNRVIRETAREIGTEYLGLHEELVSALGERGVNGKEYRPEEGLLFKALFELERRGKSIDELGERYGFLLHSDGVHLNSIGGRRAAVLLAEALSPRPP